ncbi:MAG: hypothetical protein HQL03_11655 [Nitrospirae bacterium]|nr:hypothetical protein [Nitrospirota bacterium]
MDKKLFFDTTAVVDYIFKPKKRNTIENMIDKERNIATTKYTQMEIKKGYLNNLCLLYNKLSETNTLSAICNYLHSISYTPYRKNRNILSTCLETLADFFEQNESSFEKILTHLKSLTTPDDETNKRITSLEEILKLLNNPLNDFSNKTPNNKHCWNCTDAIIAVFAPNDYAILNNNTKHFNPICKAINKESITYQDKTKK